MGVTSTAPTSRRSYLSQGELAQFANITITDTTEADDRISQAEEIIDSYAGYQDKYINNRLEGRPSAIAANSFTLQTDQVDLYDIDYFKWCEVEIVGGTGVGQRRKITGSTRAGVLTIDASWAVNPDTSSFYRIYQLGKFPRKSDVTFYSQQTPSTYYKQIPELIKRAVAAQVEYMVQMGDSYFATDKSDFQSESIGNYSYSNANGAGGASKMIAPKAKLLLRGIKNRLGTIV